MDVTTPARKVGQQDTLSRIEARLERIESMLDRFGQLADQLPGGAAMAGDIFDEWAAEDGRADERLRALTRLVDRVSRPEVLHALTVLVEQVEAAPGMIAMGVDIVDELVNQAAEQGVDMHELAANFGKALRGFVMLASREELTELLESDMFAPGAVQTLGAAARSMTAARDGGEPDRVGVFGAMGALRDPEVQRALGFAIRVAKGFGRTLGDEGVGTSKQLGAG